MTQSAKHDSDAIFEPENSEELQAFVQKSLKIVPGDHLRLRHFDQVIEYLPDEYTITVEAGVTLKAIAAHLERPRQYLPFDPPFQNSDATIGGAVASGLSGPRAFRYGILRDFIIGVTVIDGLGNEIHGGGKVVKNAAGFDLPKFFVGSAGSCGIITEATFKVFPEPPASRTAIFRFESLDRSVSCLQQLSGSSFDLDALELCEGCSIYAKLSGIEDALPERIQGIKKLLAQEPDEILEEDTNTWTRLRDFQDFPSEGTLLKAPIRPSDIARLDNAVKRANGNSRYSLGGSIAWIQSTDDLGSVSNILQEAGLAAQIVRGEHLGKLIGSQANRAFTQRIKSALDPQGKFPDLYA